jgi:imidazole glycerol-phosphate synthase subunit HisH
VTVALIDIRSGNLRSVENALRAAGAAAVAVTADPDAVRAAERIVLPGVGAFGACAAALRAVDGLEDALGEAVGARGRPFLGICVGMQLMADSGDEGGEHRGLGWIAGRVRRLAPADPAARVPHMGWNDVVPAGAHPLAAAGEAYFLHSYAVDGAGDAVLATSDHGGPVAAAIGRDTMVGVQFHPEKSQRYGLDLLRRFLDWRP